MHFLSPGSSPKIKIDGLVQNATFALLSEQWNIFDGKNHKSTWKPMETNDAMTMRPRMYRPRPFFFVRMSVRPMDAVDKKILRQTSGWPQISYRISSKFHPLGNQDCCKQQDVFCMCQAAAIWLVEIRTNGKRVAVLVEHIEVHAGSLQQGRQAGVLARLGSEPTNYSILTIF